MSDRDTYVYDGTDVLKNRFDIRDAAVLADVEQFYSHRAIVQMRRAPVIGQFDLAHYQDLHRRMFEPVYDWAGQTRTIGLWKPEIAFGGASVDYAAPALIETEAKAALAALNDAKFKDLGRRAEALGFASQIADLWRTHPFREGNTRTLFAFVEQFTRERGQPLDQTVISRVPSETRDALALATTGRVSNLVTLISQARRAEEQRTHPVLGRLTSEAVEVLRLMGKPAIVRPEIGAQIRGQVLTTSYEHVLIHNSQQVSAVSRHAFLEPPRTNQHVVVRVPDPADLPSREEIRAREQAARKEIIASVLIPAVIVPIAGQSWEEEKRNRIEIPAPSQALAEALSQNKPKEIATDPSLMAEVHTIQEALMARYGRPGAALLANGNPEKAAELLPQGEDLERIRAVLKPVQTAALSEQVATLSQARKQELTNGQSR